MRIALAQTPGTALHDWGNTQTLIQRMIAAAAPDADLVLLPECVWPAYCLETVAAYRAARHTGMPGTGAFLASLSAAARQHHVAICAGYVEEVGAQLANAAAIVDADGTVRGTTRKCCLWGFDNDLFCAGDRLEPIDTVQGPIGLMICADARLPEIAATLAARGARLILQPTAWVSVGAPNDLWNPQPEFLIPVRAAEFGVPIASCSKWGRERDTQFTGGSIVCDAAGQVVARCAKEETTVAIGTVTPGTPRAAEMSDAERDALLAAAAPELPSDAAAPHALIVRSGADVAAWHGPRHGPALALHAPAADQPTAQVIDGAGVPHALNDATVVTSAGARIAALPATRLRAFASARALALQGVHAIVATGTPPKAMFWQARACENRVFVIVAAPEAWCAIDPRGIRIAAGRWADAGGDQPVLTLPLAEAAVKEVVAGTDMIRGRRPAQYAF
jgi:predicted amidohydrolase